LLDTAANFIERKLVHFDGNAGLAGALGKVWIRLMLRRDAAGALDRNQHDPRPPLSMAAAQFGSKQGRIDNQIDLCSSLGDSLKKRVSQH